MENLQIEDVKVFVPARNFQLSLDFYLRCGWKLNWNHENSLAELELAGSRILLQDFYVKEWAENFMIYVVVDDVQVCYSHISSLIEGNEKYRDCRINPPKKEPHGIISYVWDPSGVLIHFAEHSKKS
ncbi:MAG: hypothetical protein AAGA77_05365 [Bacteroidota bacterium]